MIKTVTETFSKPVDIAKVKRAVNRKADVERYKSACEKLLAMPLNTLSCFICHAENSTREIVAEVYGFEYIECQHCGHVYLDRFPSWKDFAEIENDIATQMSRTLYENKEVNQDRIRVIAKPKIDYILNYIGKKDGFWIDVGCGTGEIVYAVQECGWHAFGVDVNESSRKFGKEAYGVDIKHPDQMTEPLLKNVDVVSAFNVLEHVSDPYNFLRPYVQVSADAHFVIEVPHFNSYSSKAQKSFNQHINRHLIPCNHFQLFTQPSLEKLLDRLDLEPINYWWFGQDIYETIQLMASEYKDFQKTEVYSFFCEHLNEFQSVVDNQRASDALFVIAKKK